MTQPKFSLTRSLLLTAALLGVLSLIFGAHLSVAFAQGDPNDPNDPNNFEFKDAPKKKNKSVKFQECRLFANEGGDYENSKKVTITRRGRAAEISNNFNAEEYKFDTRYGQFACGDTEGDGEDSLFARLDANSPIIEFDLTEASFPESENDLGGACSSVEDIPSQFVYKTVGSEHFVGDPRRFAFNLPIRPGWNGPIVSCVDVLSENGEVLANMGLYQTGFGWTARYYNNFGCGAHQNLSGSALASRARASAGSNNVTFRFGKKCYSSVDATRCLGSTSC